jgi:hypothetical protein
MKHSILQITGLLSSTSAFVFAPRIVTVTSPRSIPSVKMAEASDLSEPEQMVYHLVEELHSCNFPFRIVVVGNGAILETTSTLGPHMKLNKSPKSGEYLITLANEDQSFEFHMKPSEVSKVVLTEKATLPDAGPGMKILRFMNKQGGSMCSLILGEKTEAGGAWFQGMISKYGQEIEL